MAKLNIDCVRDILLAVEKRPYGEMWALDDIKEQLEAHQREEIEYALLKLDEGRLLDVQLTQMLRQPISVARIDDITYVGHEFLEHVRCEENWNKIKNVSKKVGSTGIRTLLEISSGIITAAIKSQFEL